MKEVDCISCKQEIPLTGPFVEFECPICGAKIARCEKCRTFGHAYKCECGFEGPQISLKGELKMSDVVATMKIMPESPEVDLAALKAAIEAAIPDDAEFHKIDEEPIAFGLVALNLMFIIEDGEGGTGSTEEAMANLDGVASIEIVDTRRLM